MKIRTGFVSNSSSSSFVCDVCGEECSGMDMSLSDADMCECENGHTFCTSHTLNVDEEDEIEDMYSVGAKHCPVCQFQSMTDRDLRSWFFATRRDLNEKSLLQLWKKEFESYDGFKKFIGEEREN